MDCNQVQIFLIAGGNPTGILWYPDDKNRLNYRKTAKKYMDRDSSIEQFGFLEGTSRIKMSGGEFCGNAACVAAYLISERTKKSSGVFTVSGFSGSVRYLVKGQTVQCVFPDYLFKRQRAEVLGVEVTLIDLGGIVHVVLPPTVKFENSTRYFTKVFDDIKKTLGLGYRPAVGVIWQEPTAVEILIRPVVWVRDINSFFYESACGSGSLAMVIARNVSQQNIIQPSGQLILAECLNGTTLSLTSSVQLRGRSE